jgi:type IV secretion system protein VirD4
MSWLFPTEREKWATPAALAQPRSYMGLPALDAGDQLLYGRLLPRGVLLPRFMPDRPPVNYWMAPEDLLQHAFLPGQLLLGKMAGRLLGHLDDRPMVTIAGARSGKTSTVLEPNLYLYPGSILALDPKSELCRTAPLRRALGHNVFVLDAFGHSGEPSACFNALAELDPDSDTIIDDVAGITQALIVDEGDARARHWNDSARTLLGGITLFVLTLPEQHRHLVTVRQLLTLAHPALSDAVRRQRDIARAESADEDYYDENRLAVRTLLKAMAKVGDRFDGILAAIGERFLNTPQTERGSIFSTAAAQTDFLDSLPIRRISMRSDFRLRWLRDAPTTIYLCLPVGRMQSHYRWLRLIVQMACTVLEQMGPFPRSQPPVLFMMEEFATLGHMEIMERAAAYFPSFGVKLWAVLQDLSQLQRYYRSGFETFLGNAGLVQCFANSDELTLSYISRRLGTLAAPFELRTAFARQNFSQILMFEGEPPAAAMRLGHEEVAGMHAHLIAWVRRQAGSRAGAWR